MDLIDLIFPKRCLECNKEGLYICTSCLSKMSEISAICPVCEKASIDGLTHIKCKKHFGLDGLVCLWPYERVIRKAIIAFKYKFAKEVAREVSEHVPGEIQQYKFTLP